jgi:hypothetical protein
VKEAEKAGYIEFMPWLQDQSIFHYNNIGNVLLTMQSFDATKPVSLLYVKSAKGEKVLTGAMYAAPPERHDRRPGRAASASA